MIPPAFAIVIIMALVAVFVGFLVCLFWDLFHDQEDNFDE